MRLCFCLSRFLLRIRASSSWTIPPFHHVDPHPSPPRSPRCHPRSRLPLEYRPPLPPSGAPFLILPLPSHPEAAPAFTSQPLRLQTQASFPAQRPPPARLTPYTTTCPRAHTARILGLLTHSTALMVTLRRAHSPSRRYPTPRSCIVIELIWAPSCSMP